MFTRLRIDTVTMTIPLSLREGLLAAIKADLWMLDQQIIKNGDDVVLRGVKTMLGNIHVLVTEALTIEDFAETDPAKLDIPIYVGDGTIPSREVELWLKLVASLGMLAERMSVLVTASDKHVELKTEPLPISIAIYKQVLSTMASLRCQILSGFRQKYANMSEGNRNDIRRKLKACLDIHDERRKSMDKKIEEHQQFDTFYRSALSNIQS